MNKPKWILLAEDDAAIAELTMLALAPDKLACQVIIVHNGLEALDCLQQHGEWQTRDSGNPAFVLLDLKMPMVDGLEVLQQIKSDARLKYIPVVMFTSSREIADISHSYQLGANAYVVKPADFHEFSKILQQVGIFWGTLNEPPPECLEMEASHSAAGAAATARLVAA